MFFNLLNIHQFSKFPILQVLNKWLNFIKMFINKTISDTIDSWFLFHDCFYQRGKLKYKSTLCVRDF